MPAIAATNFGSNGVTVVTETTLNGTDTLTYTAGRSKYLILRNPTGGAISPVIDGAGSVSEYVPGLGTVVTSGGYAVGSIGAGAVRTVSLDSIASYLKGVIAVNSGTGLVAVLVNV